MFMSCQWLHGHFLIRNLTTNEIQQQIRNKVDENGAKLFQPDDYPAINQTKYHCRKRSKEHGAPVQEKVIAELIADNIEQGTGGILT